MSSFPQLTIGLPSYSEERSLSLTTDALRGPPWLRSMLFGGRDDCAYGVARTKVILRTHLYRGHRYAHRTRQQTIRPADPRAGPRETRCRCL